MVTVTMSRPAASTAYVTAHCILVTTPLPMLYRLRQRLRKAVTAPAASNWHAGGQDSNQDKQPLGVHIGKGSRGGAGRTAGGRLGSRAGGDIQSRHALEKPGEKYTPKECSTGQPQWTTICQLLRRLARNQHTTRHSHSEVWPLQRRAGVQRPVHPCSCLHHSENPRRWK